METIIYNIINKTHKMPHLYNEIPSLNELIAFVNENSEHFYDLELTVLQDYYSNTIDKWSEGKYYLHGQLPLLPDTPITNQIMDDAKNIHIQRSIEYGNPCNSFESASIACSITRYKQLIQILDRYQTISLHLLYAPGTGTEYLKGKERFEHRSK
jgi:hypothetical protein